MGIQNNSFTDDELEMMSHGDNPVANAYRELLALRKAFERPDCWEIAGCIFSTEEEALKPGFRGTPEPLYSKPDLTE